MGNKKNMRIGIDARMFSSAFTGVGRYTFELITHLAQFDTENEYLIFLNYPEYKRFKPPAKNFQKCLAGAKHYSLGEQTRFLLVLLRAQLDLMHFTHFNAPLFYRRPCVVTIHDLTLSFFPGKKMTKWLHRFSYYRILHSIVARAQKIIAVSKNTKKDILGIYHLQNDKVKVIPNGVGQEFKKKPKAEILKKTREKYDIKDDFLLYTGVWRDHKNVIGLIKSFELLKRRGFPGLLIITGRENPIYPEVKEKVVKSNFHNSIKLIGLVSEKELNALYHLARVYVFPSFYEGFGLPILEAFAAGTPVAASNTSSIPEVCEGQAILFDPYCVEDMAEKIFMIWQDKSLRQEFIAGGKKQSKKFSWEKMAKETWEVYRSLRE